MTHPPMDEAGLLEHLARMDVPVTLYRHEPLFTVEQSSKIAHTMPGTHCKNMFLKSKAGELVLVTCIETRRIRIRDLERRIGTRKLSFASPDLLLTHLGVTPGAVTPLAVLNDRAGAVRVILDEQMMAGGTLNCHPLHNAATVAISTDDLLRVLHASGHAPELVDFDALEQAAHAVEAT